MIDKHLQSLKGYQGEDRVIPATEMDLILSKQVDSLLNVKSKLPALDKYIDGFRDGEVYAISGPTKMGKTLLAQTLTANFIQQQVFPLWFTYEVPAKQFLSQFKELPFIYMPSRLKAHSMKWIEERILESFVKYNTRVIFIDHLHYLFDIAQTRSPSLEIGSVIRKLKTIAVNSGFIIFLLCHTMKGRSDDNLTYESIRDSSFVSQESDSVFMIKRTPDKGENKARLRIEFHRRTGVLEKVIELEKIGHYLREVTEREEPEKGYLALANTLQRGYDRQGQDRIETAKNNRYVRKIREHARSNAEG